ncbi:hypothetical protein TNCV_1868231 [Trichonephila clavipes]|nr:hypothetical protein TNCV_1868231 [Trichonephila clavipes]
MRAFLIGTFARCKQHQQVTGTANDTGQAVLLCPIYYQDEIVRSVTLMRCPLRHTDVAFLCSLPGFRMDLCSSVYCIHTGFTVHKEFVFLQ